MDSVIVVVVMTTVCNNDKYIIVLFNLKCITEALYIIAPAYNTVQF